LQRDERAKFFNALIKAFERFVNARRAGDSELGFGALKIVVRLRREAAPERARNHQPLL